MTTKRKIAEATAIVLAFSLLGKVLGFAREMVIAALFGTTYATDAYFVGLAGPDFIREIISGGVLTAVFIPLYTSCLAKNDPEGSKKILNSIVTLLLAAMLAAVLLGIPFAPYLVKAIAPELEPETFALAVQITRILFPSILFMGLASFYGSLLNIHKHFAAPSMAQLMLNVGIIGGVVGLGARWGIKSLAYGFFIGAILQFVILLPSLGSKGISYRPVFVWSPELKKMLYLWVPLFIASFAAIANDLVSRSLAAGLPPGNIAAITFANRIRETIWLVCGVPLGTAIFPYLSSHAANDEKGELEKITLFAFRITAFMALPLSLLMFFFSEPIIRLLFQRGIFDQTSTAITSQALLFYAAGALFYALNYIILRVFYSMHDAYTPLKAFAAALAINIVSGIILRKYLFIGGIALARSISDFVSFAYLLFALSRYLKGLRLGGIGGSMAKIAILSLSSVMLSYVIYHGLPAGGTTLQQLGMLAISWAFGFVCYIGAGVFFKVYEVSYVWNKVWKKVTA